ncbi:MAG: hypothetical protein IT209_04480 [Armatimonadetes bacterium]|nr:hypothetical protein [Armatimonadota bacterium]
MPYRYDASVQEVIRETPDVVTLRLGPTPASLMWDPGQFVMLSCQTPQGLLRRAYSIANPPGRSGHIDITVRAGTGVSAFLCNGISAGSEIAFSGPYGRFIYRETDSDSIGLVAAGSGIVPLMCILRHLRDTRANVSRALLLSDRSEDDLIYRKELLQMSESAGLELSFALTRPTADDWRGFNGRINREMTARWLDGLRATPDRFFVCGPLEMCRETKEHLIGLGARPDRVLTEFFG